MVAPVRFLGAEKVIFLNKDNGQQYSRKALSRIVTTWEGQSGSVGLEQQDHYLRTTSHAPQINNSGLSDEAYIIDLNTRSNINRISLVRSAEQKGIDTTTALSEAVRTDFKEDDLLRAFERQVQAYIADSNQPLRTILVSGEGKNLQFEESTS